MGAQPQTSGITSIANIELANTVDYHIASSNWIPIVERYVNEVATYLVYSYTKQTADPISSQATFFFDLNSNTLDLRSDIRGSVDSGSVDNLIKDYKQIKLNTLLEPGEIWIKDDDNRPETKTFSGGVSAYHAYNFFQKEDKWYEFTENTNDIVRENLDKLQNEYGQQFMPLEFQMFWYEKFKKTHDYVQKEYNQIMKDANIDPSDNMFADLSDSIGCIVRSAEVLNPNDTNLIVDRDMKQSLLADSIISTLAPQTFEKLDKETQKFDVEMCVQTNAVFRSNMRNVIQTLATARAPHDESLVTDTAHIRRIQDMQSDLIGLVANTIGVGYSLLFYHNNKLNKQHLSSSPNISLIVEDSNVRVDMLKNTIKNINKLFGNRSLIPRDITSQDQS